MTGTLDLSRFLAPGTTAYIPGTTGEMAPLQNLLSSQSSCLENVELLGCLVPGMNEFDYTLLHPKVRLTTFLFPPIFRAAHLESRVKVMPLAYTGIAEFLETTPIDTAFLHLTPPRNGTSSFGVVADFGPIVFNTAKRKIGLINPMMPEPVDTPRIAVDALDALIEINAPLPVILPAEPSPEVTSLARNVANLIPDGAHLQTGIGAAPAALWSALAGHRGLRLRSGMVTDGFFTANEAGAMAQEGHVVGIACGSASLYERLDRSDLISFTDTRSTHGAHALSRLERFVSVNSALGVDLFGQANLEWQGERLISGVGGASDFVRAARISHGGVSIIALPATAKRGTISRIESRLACPISINRSDIDWVVTEYGAAHLSTGSMDERARALIDIAAPQHRARLENDWLAMRRAM